MPPPNSTDESDENLILSRPSRFRHIFISSEESNPTQERMVRLPPMIRLLHESVVELQSDLGCVRLALYRPYEASTSYIARTLTLTSIPMEDFDALTILAVLSSHAYRQAKQCSVLALISRTFLPRSKSSWYQTLAISCLRSIRDSPSGLLLPISAVMPTCWRLFDLGQTLTHIQRVSCLTYLQKLSVGSTSWSEVLLMPMRLRGGGPLMRSSNLSLASSHAP